MHRVRNTDRDTETAQGDRSWDRLWQRQTDLETQRQAQRQRHKKICRDRDTEAQRFRDRHRDRHRETHKDRDWDRDGDRDRAMMRVKERWWERQRERERQRQRDRVIENSWWFRCRCLILVMDIIDVAMHRHRNLLWVPSIEFWERFRLNKNQVVCATIYIHTTSMIQCSPMCDTSDKSRLVRYTRSQDNGENEVRTKFYNFWVFTET